MSNRPEKMVCTRYAPSPTGFLHVGGARTALFNYLYAKKKNGKFILRIEDTDDSRNIPDGHLEIESSLKLLNIFPDESFSIPGSVGPYIQSQKLSRYRSECERLLREGKAYRCFCTEEELQEFKKLAEEQGLTYKYSQKCRGLSEEEINRRLSEKQAFTVRVKVDICSEYKWDDLIRGSISIPADSMGDRVIMRSNNTPTYNFAVVIDDIDMEITCVLRGEEHISNTPYQIAIYYALGYQDRIPEFGHLSIIVDENGKKLSKRSQDEFHFVSGLVEKGYVPEAIINFLALLGWSYKETEIFSKEELIKLFSTDGINKAPAFFDIKKLNWINRKYLQEMNPDYYLNYLVPIFTVDLGEHENKKKTFALAQKKNIDYGAQLNDMAVEFYRPRVLNDRLVEILKENKDLINLAYEYFPQQIEEWNQLTIRNYLKQLSQISGLKGKNLYKPLRVAFSFKEEEFELINVMECLGRGLIFDYLSKSWETIRNE